MYRLTTARQFERDYKLCKKRGWKMSLLNELFLELEKTSTVPAKNKPHKLTGNYKNFWECHIQPDWLLIWLKNDAAGVIELARTGTHSDLF